MAHTQLNLEYLKSKDFESAVNLIAKTEAM
jgi:hypothetical protein